MLLREAPGVRVGLRHCVQRMPLGSTIEYQIQRAGERITLDVEAQPRRPRLLPPRQPTPRPEWLVLGGLVFTPLLPDYEGLVPKCKLQMIHGPPTPECEQVRHRAQHWLLSEHESDMNPRLYKDAPAARQLGTRGYRLRHCALTMPPCSNPSVHAYFSNPRASPHR